MDEPAAGCRPARGKAPTLSLHDGGSVAVWLPWLPAQRPHRHPCLRGSFVQTQPFLSCSGHGSPGDLTPEARPLRTPSCAGLPAWPSSVWTALLSRPRLQPRPLPLIPGTPPAPSPPSQPHRLPAATFLPRPPSWPLLLPTVSWVLARGTATQFQVVLSRGWHGTVGAKSCGRLYKTKGSFKPSRPTPSRSTLCSALRWTSEWGRESGQTGTGSQAGCRRPPGFSPEAIMEALRRWSAAGASAGLGDADKSAAFATTQRVVGGRAA